MTTAEDATTVAGGMMTAVGDATTVAGGTMTAAADATTATVVAAASPWATGATVKAVQATALDRMMTLPQPLTLLRQPRRHQATRSTRPSMMLASTQPSAPVTRDLARSGIQQLLQHPHLHLLPRIRCLICLPRLLLHRSSSRRSNNRPQPPRLMHSVSHRRQLHRR